MNEEEKEAIFEIEKLTIEIYKYMDIEKTRFYRDKYKIILNLIEKQQKEIKFLKKQIPQDKIFYYSEKDYISKDKIKAKIEKIDEEIKTSREIAKNPPDRVSGRLLADHIVELEKTKKVLQSFLEGE